MGVLADLTHLKALTLEHWGSLLLSLMMFINFIS